MSSIMDTICAISTPLGEGGVCVLRISGDGAIPIAQTVCSRNLSDVPPRFLMRTNIIKNGDILDDAMVCIFRSPNSFTGEDVVELHCHGGVALAKTVLNMLFSAGATQAEAGEFTRRAFLNGKIDLTKAEAIGDIIHAQTEEAVKIAGNTMGGAICSEISEVRTELIKLVASLFVDMDYEDVESGVDWRGVLNLATKRLRKLLGTAENGIIAQSGLNVAIVGRPNVGKSSLLNALLGENRAIVTEVAGTTRDVLRERANINGHLVNFVDTAGIRDTLDVVEKIGVERAREQLESANVVLVVMDASQRETAEDKAIIEATASKPRIVVHNKIDIADSSFKYCIEDSGVGLSAKTGEGITELCDKIAKMCGEVPRNEPVIANIRQKQQVERALAQLEINANAPLDAIATAVENAISTLGEVIGENVSEEIVTEIFSKFCVGK